MYRCPKYFGGCATLLAQEQLNTSYEDVSDLVIRSLPVSVILREGVQQWQQARIPKPPLSWDIRT